MQGLKNALLPNFAAVALLGALLAYWSWTWLGPAPAPRAPSAATAAGAAAAGGLFGAVKQGASAAGPGGTGTLRLVGVVADSAERRGHAVLRLDRKHTVAVLQGEEVEPGLRLAEVHADHVVLERNGAREALAWPEKGRQ
jgi:general secretion pathway protein C